MQTIKETQPDVVLVELCNSRVNILKYDEDTLLEEAKNINLGKLRAAIKQGGVVQGVMHLLLLSMSAHLTKELGMAPGGEFRRAFQEVSSLPSCVQSFSHHAVQAYTMLVHVCVGAEVTRLLGEAGRQANPGDTEACPRLIVCLAEGSTYVVSSHQQGTYHEGGSGEMQAEGPARGDASRDDGRVS